jgi:uncharacterized protein YpuA (DUF1002 family)
MENVGVNINDISIEYIYERFYNQNKYYEWENILGQIQQYADCQKKDLLNFIDYTAR